MGIRQRERKGRRAVDNFNGKRKQARSVMIIQPGAINCKERGAGLELKNRWTRILSNRRNRQERNARQREAKQNNKFEEGK